ncbi:MAG TPA: hypothetical protein VMZ06_18660, partial [Candidatus Bathyarchaeia archaeon]|nr:hypothetical protein [Candidatus Bathyarchaeia archaeon]
MEKPFDAYPGKPQARLGGTVVSMLVLGIVLGLSFQFLRKTGLLGSPYRDMLGLAAMLSLVGSGWLVIRRVYSIRRIALLFGSGTALLLLTQVMNVVEELPIPGGMPEMARKLIFDGYLRELPLFAGVGLIFAGFYLCIFETDAAKRRLAQDAEQLARQIKERERI